MKKHFILLIVICSLLGQLIINTFNSQASDNNIDPLPAIGAISTVSDFTEDQAKWAYAEYLGELLKQEEVRLMSSIIWCEAGNQCEAGQQAVGIVVMNRVASEDFENDIKSVIYEKGQFRPKTDGKLAKALAMYDEGELPQECIDAALYALDGNTTVNYNGVEIDMSEFLYFARYWQDATLTIQDHDFK